MKRKPPYRDGRIHVLSERCQTCVFRPGNLMHLMPGRMKNLVESNLHQDAALTCHKTLHGVSGAGEAICRGFFDAYGNEVSPLRMAIVLNLITEVTL